jgi:hypothetical protein
VRWQLASFALIFALSFASNMAAQSSQTPPGPLPARHRSPTERIVPRGRLTSHGIVIEKTADKLVLRMRDRSEKTFHLRPDTDFFEDGRAVEAPALRLNTRVFVRAGLGLMDELEAYTVIWGEIVDPRR